MPDTSYHTSVIPNGTIILYDDIPLDNEYTHTINRYANGNSDLSVLLATYPHKTLTGQTYSRLTENSVRVGLSKEQLIHCNYMLIKNGAYYVNGETNALTQGENKIFYAFVTDVEYVNNVTSDVYFTVDYLQTYWYNFTIPANFIEREHCLVSEDLPENNLIPESLELGEMICERESVGVYYLKNQLYTVIMYTPNLTEAPDDKPYVVYSPPVCITASQPTAEQCRPNFRNKIGGIVFCLVIPMNMNDETSYALSLGAVTSGIDAVNFAKGSVVSVFTITQQIYEDNFQTTSVTERTFSVPQNLSFKRTDNTTYTPRNKKLYQAPFRKLVVSNNNGNIAEYDWQLFSSRNNGQIVANFSYYNALVPELKAYIYPLQYRGLAQDFENGVTLDDFPKPCWTEDSYTKWWAQNKANMGISLATGIIGTALTIGTGAKAGSLLAGQIANRGAEDLANFADANQQGYFGLARGYKNSALNSFEREQNVRAGARRNMAISGAMGAGGIARTLGQIATAKATPDNTHVQNNSAIINLLHDRLGFTFYDIGITGEMAEIIDNYFDMYGYASHRVKVPNFIGENRRNIWNYVKMQNCFIKAQTGDRGLPETAQKSIQAVFNNGVTLWNKISDVGNYNLANSNR